MITSHLFSDMNDFYLPSFCLQLEEEKLALQHQCNDHQNDIQSLRKELLQAEQQKLDLESDKVSLSEKCKFLDIEKGKVIFHLFHFTTEFIILVFRLKWNSTK